MSVVEGRLPPPPDTAMWRILAANAFAILVALRDDTGFLSLLWIYWAQSVIIGWFARERMQALEYVNIAEPTPSDLEAATPLGTSKFAGNFFALHYGLFHLGYLAFLVSTQRGTAGADIGRLDLLDGIFVAAAVLGFWHTHRESHRANLEADLAHLPNVAVLMLIPYPRVVPMHAAILIGYHAGAGRGFLFFALLKTAADLAMHKLEHRWLQGGRE